MDAKLVRLARAIHLAKLKECYFKNHDGYTGYEAALLRQPWPEDRKDFERLYQAGQSWMDIAMAQARAAMKEMNND